jgi:hypothetical protein
MLPFDKCQPLALRDLTLQKINLRYASDTYCQFIDFKTIKCLRVFGCSGADSLFAELSKSNKLPGRLETLEFKHDDNAENDALSALDGFLCLVSGLKVLTVDICFAKTLPLAAGITRHSRTLRELNVHASRGDSDEEELVYAFDEFEKICKNCTEMEQLSCAFPPTSIIRTSSDEYVAFEVRFSHAIIKMVLWRLTLSRRRLASCRNSSRSISRPGLTTCRRRRGCRARFTSTCCKAWRRRGSSAARCKRRHARASARRQRRRQRQHHRCRHRSRHRSQPPSPRPHRRRRRRRRPQRQRRPRRRGWPSWPGAPATRCTTARTRATKSSLCAAARRTRLAAGARRRWPCRSAGACASTLSRGPTCWTLLSLAAVGRRRGSRSPARRATSGSFLALLAGLLLCGERPFHSSAAVGLTHVRPASWLFFVRYLNM